MTPDQKTVAIGAGIGVLTMIAAMVGISQVWADTSMPTDIAGRLAYTLKANALAAIPLLVGTITVGNNRFLSEAIDPMLQKEDQATLINGRVLDNTLQQYVLFVVGTLALSVSLTPANMPVIAAATIVFIVARFAFWIGYRIHPLYRAFGMAATMYLNIGILAWAGWKIVVA
ncbi:MAPEG family protein [Bradyrhizobium paxllaeri]|uniref:MAPEG family protein n=1 Tax=Bradyrhizobium paxllaeri TaxID=190148 RepID=UPI000810631B|nr:MAPEG family protein [Bradyrhizobium paxllaeri]